MTFPEEFTEWLHGQFRLLVFLVGTDTIKEWLDEYEGRP